MSDEKTPIDIEALVQWTMARTGYLPWRGVSERELMFDYGYTAIPEGAPGGFRSGCERLRQVVDDDAATVIAAIEALGWPASRLVVANGKAGIQPNWLEGIEPRLVPVKKRCGKKHRKVVVGHRWEPCHPQAICAARDAYRDWHSGLRRLAAVLGDSLIAWRINGFAAPEAPWEPALQKAA